MDWFPIITLVLGFALGFLADIVKSNIQLSNSLKEIIFNKRVVEVENISRLMNELNSFFETDEDKNYPSLLSTSEELTEYIIKLEQYIDHLCNYWLSPDLRHILIRLHTYLNILIEITKDYNEQERIDIGVEIYQDFISFILFFDNYNVDYLNSIPTRKVFKLEKIPPDKKEIKNLLYESNLYKKYKTKSE